MTMLCSRAVRLMSGLEQGRVLARHCLQAQARGEGNSYCQELYGEARAGRRMLERSGLGVSSRMLSAVAFFIVPRLLLFMFSGSSADGGGGGARSEGVSSLDRAQRPGQPIGEIQWNDLYHNLLLKVGWDEVDLSMKHFVRVRFRKW